VQNSSLETNHQPPFLFRSLFPSSSVSDESLADIFVHPFLIIASNKLLRPYLPLFLFQFRPVILYFPISPLSSTRWHTEATQPPLQAANLLPPLPLPTSPHTFTLPHLTQWQTTTTLPTVPMEHPTTHILAYPALSTREREDVGAYPVGCLIMSLADEMTCSLGRAAFDGR